jgi:hypothetical protein
LRLPLRRLHPRTCTTDTITGIIMGSGITRTVDRRRIYPVLKRLAGRGVLPAETLFKAEFTDALVGIVR